MASKNVIEILINAEDNSTKVLGGVGKALTGLGTIAATAAAATVAATAAIGAGLVKLAVDAAPLEGIGIAFDKMAERVGLSLDDLREASAGTISDFELMRKANIALTGAGEELGQAFGEEMPALLEIARAAARATGQDVDFLFQSLVTGVKRGSPMLIDNTGLVLKLGEANEAMAAQLGKSVEELTAEEKSVALLNATVEAGQKMVSEFGGGTVTAAEQMAQFRATLQNTKDQIGVAMLPALQALMKPLADLAEKAGPKVVGFAEELGQWLGEKIPIAIDAFEGAFDLATKAISAFARGFSEEGLYIGLENLFDVLGITPPSALWDALDKILPIARSIVEWLGEKIPIAIDWLMQAVSELTESFQKGFEAAGLEAGLRNLLGTFLDMVGIPENITDAIFSMINIIQDFAQNAVPIAINAVEALRSWWVENWPTIQAVFLTTWEIIKAAALSVIEVFMTQVIPPFQQAFANLAEALGKLGIDWSDIWNAIKGAIEIVAIAIGAIILALIGTITGIVTAFASVAEHVTATLSDIADTFMLGLESISNLVGGAMAIIKGIFTGDLDLIMAGWQAWKEGLVGLTTALFEGIINLFNLSFGTLIAAVSGFISGVIGFFTNLKDTLIGGSIIPEMMGSMLEIISSALADILGNIASFISDVIAAFSGLGDSLYSVGASIMEGLKSGIMSKVDEILSAIRNIVDNLIQEAKNALDILSPSGVFASIGASMMEGMALGIGGASALPAMAAVGAASNVSRTVNNYFNMSVSTRATTPGVVRDFETMKALVG